MPPQHAEMPVLTNRALLQVFYQPVLDLTRLEQATVVPHDLDPVETGKEDPWRWSASMPMQVQKLWSRLQEVREQVQRSPEDNSNPADPELVRGCMYLLSIMDQEALQVDRQLAMLFIRRLLGISNEDAKYAVTLYRSPSVSAAVRGVWESGEYQDALALYFKTLIGNSLDAEARRQSRAAAEN